MKILLIDDEPLALDRLERLLQEHKAGTILKAKTPEEGLKIFRDHLRTTPIHLIFLDIHMPGTSGIELAWQFLELMPQCRIVFQTAHSDYSLEAFEIGSLDYLLKPIRSEEIARVLKRVKNLYSVPKSETLFFNAKLGDEIYILKPEEIYYVKADLEEVQLRSMEKSCYYSRKISDLEPILVTHGFFRIHRSYLLNLHKVKRLTPLSQSRYEVHFHDISETIETSKDGAKLLRLHLDHLGQNF